MSMNIRLLLPIALLAVWGCQKSADTLPDNAAARVGSQTITEEDVTERLVLLSEEDRNFAKTSFGRQNLLQIITREKLIAAAAKEDGLEQDDVYLSILEDKRAQMAQTYREFAAQTLERMWYNKLQESGVTHVTNEEIKAYYDKYPYEMTVKQIIVDNAQTADQVLRTLKSSSSYWNTLSKQYNTAPEALQQLSFMPGEYLSEIEVVAANSPLGKVQGFFKTPQGFHIIMKTKEKRLSRQEAEPRIRQVLEGQKLDKVLDSLKNKYEVVIYEKSE